MGRRDTKITEFSRFLTQLLEGEGKRGDQETLSQDTGISTGALSNWKAGTKPKFESVLKLARHLRRSPAELFRMAEMEEQARIYEEFCGSKDLPECRDSDVYERDRLPWHRSLEVVLDGSDRLEPEALNLVQAAISHAENLLSSRADPQHGKRKTRESGMEPRR